MMPTFSKHSLQYFFLMPLPSRSLAMLESHLPIGSLRADRSEQPILVVRAGRRLGRGRHGTLLEEVHRFATELEALALRSLRRGPLPHLQPALDEHGAALLQILRADLGETLVGQHRDE